MLSNKSKLVHLQIRLQLQYIIVSKTIYFYLCLCTIKF